MKEEVAEKPEGNSKGPSRIRTGDGGFAIRGTGNISPNQKSTSGDDENSLSSCLSFLQSIDPDLALVIERWESLPPPVRAGILAMVRAS